MIVYGDPSFEDDLPVLLARFQSRCHSAAALCHTWLLGAAASGKLQAELRALLIYAGQLEQAIHDAPDAQMTVEARQQWAARMEAQTDAAARALTAMYSDSQDRYPGTRRVFSEAFASIGLDGEEIEDAPNARLVVKMPEGFAFYALYPEQYRESALRWAREHAPYQHESVLVVGIRSIGTSLSALVCAALQAEGWSAKRVSVRPTGHPYARALNLPPAIIAQVTWILIVDEGPGMSGSSFAAVAEALAQAGMLPERIAFLPGHGGEPGGQGSEEVKHWWAITPRYVTALENIHGRSHKLLPFLAARAAAPGAKSDSDARAEQVTNVSGGLWRSEVYTDAKQWPAACAAFERPKYLCAIPNGQALLWKFAGLATEQNGKEQAANLYERLTALSQEGWTPAPVCAASGFVALPWVHGRMLTHAEADEDTLRHIGLYIAAASNLPQSAAENKAAIHRLAHMLYWNVWEALGEDAAPTTQAYAEAVQNSTWITNSRTYGDGRLFPHQWLQTPDGQILKTGGGQGADHTVVGRQSLAWDVAGAMVEWRLDDTTAKPLLNAVEKAVETAIPTDVLAFFSLAYAAFRAGQTALCAQMSGHDPAEQTRLWQAHAAYKSQVANKLALG